MTLGIDPLEKPEQEDENLQVNADSQLDNVSKENASPPKKVFKSQETKAVNFFFYADTEIDAKALVKELKLNKYGKGITIFHSEDRYSIIGYTDKELMNSQPFDKWILQMNELAYRLDCEFDGWGNVV